MRIFVIVWLGQMVSLIGSNLTGFALGVWVYRDTGSVMQFALISLCTILPFVVLSPLAGAVVDRWNHRSTMILGDTGAALSTLAMAALLFSGKLETWHIYVATGVSSAFGAFQWPAYNAAVTLLVPKQQLGRANGMIQMSWAVAQLIAPLLGALLLENIALEGVILLDFTSFLFAVLVLLFLRFPRRTARTTEAILKASTLLRDIGDGWSYIASRPGLLGLFVYFAAYNFLVGIVEVLVTPLVLSFASTVALGTILSVGGMGTVIGGVTMSIWGGPQRRMLAVFGCMLLCGLCTAVAGMSVSVTIVALAAFFFFLGLPIINVCTQVIVQEKVAPALQGRVLAFRIGIQQAALPLGYVVAGPLADHVFEPLMSVNGPLSDSLGQVIGAGPGRGIGLMFVIVGLLMQAFTLIAYCSPRMRRVQEELPDEIPDEDVSGDARPVAI